MTLNRRLSVYSSIILLLIATASFSLRSGNDFNSRAVNIDVVVKGTSTLHDWEMKSNKAFVNAVFSFEKDKINDLTGLTFSMDAESIKSDNKSLDNNAYKALKTNKHKAISFVLTNANVIPGDAVTYSVKAIGKLTIAGTTKETDLTATVKYNPADKSFTVFGSKKLKMTDYGVTPPSLMLGTIKTGNDITVSFNAKIK